jgi:hypothetical protein
MGRSFEQCRPQGAGLQEAIVLLHRYEAEYGKGKEKSEKPDESRLSAMDPPQSREDSVADQPVRSLIPSAQSVVRWSKRAVFMACARCKIN